MRCIVAEEVEQEWMVKKMIETLLTLAGMFIIAIVMFLVYLRG